MHTQVQNQLQHTKFTVRVLVHLGAFGWISVALVAELVHALEASVASAREVDKLARVDGV